MKNYIKKGKGASSSIIATVIVALITVVVIVAYFSMTTVFVVTANMTIPAGTKITSEMLQSGAIVQKEVNKSYFQENELNWVVSDMNQLNGMYVQNELRTGKMIYTYDIADRYDIRTNPYLIENDYEAFALTTGTFSMGKTTNLLEKGDRINIYAIYHLDISGIKNMKEYQVGNGGWGSNDDEITAADAFAVRVKELPEYAKNICLNSGMQEDDLIYDDELTLAKLVYQNVPIINITKIGDGATASISEMIIAVDAKTAEELYVLMEKASLGCTLLPYVDGEYNVIDNSGSVDIAIEDYGKTFATATVTAQQ